MDTSGREAERKYEALKEYIIELGSVAVAFSGGVDSAFLVKAAKDVLGGNATAVTVRSVLLPAREFGEAAEFCKKYGIHQVVCPYDALSVNGLTDNTKNRCYLCKRSFLGQVKDLAKDMGIRHVLEGSNADDDSDYRPGMRAVKELGIVSPLQILGFTKEDIRLLAREQGLSVWNKPSAACLASRIAYGEKITEEKLSRIEQAEDYLHQAGFAQVRVRMHGSLARIEAAPEQMAELFGQREKIAEQLQKYGFIYVSVDLKGYRTGSMNEAD